MLQHTEAGGLPQVQGHHGLHNKFQERVCMIYMCVYVCMLYVYMCIMCVYVVCVYVCNVCVCVCARVCARESARG